MDEQRLMRILRQDRKPHIQICAPRLCPHCSGELTPRYYTFRRGTVTEVAPSFAAICRAAAYYTRKAVHA